MRQCNNIVNRHKYLKKKYSQLLLPHYLLLGEMIERELDMRSHDIF